MQIGIAVLIFFTLLILSYQMFEGDIVSPSFIFVVMFMLSFFDVLLCLSMWNTTLALNTLTVLITGATVFVFVSLMIHFVFAKINKTDTKRSIPNKKSEYIKISTWKMLAFFIFQCVVIFYMQKYIKILMAPYVTDGSLSSAVSMYQYLKKFTVLQLDFPKILTYSFVLSSSSSFVWGYVSIHNFYYYRKWDPWVLINLILSLGGSFITGSRGVALQAIMTLLVFYVLLYRDGPKKINVRKVLLFPSLLMIGILVSFRFMAGLLGRDDSLGLFEYVSVYLGAPIKNLDTFLNTQTIQNSQFWGYNTFSMQWKWLSDTFNLNIPATAINTNMQYLNGHNLGNVFTAYKDFISDFGYIGAMVCVAVMAIIVGVLYENTKGENKKKLMFKIDWMKLTYAYLVIVAGFTFFSDKFFETFTVTFIERILCWILLGYFFCTLVPRRTNLNESKNSTRNKGDGI